jgi:Capsule polysaccharide biosynthesis protein
MITLTCTSAGGATTDTHLEHWLTAERRDAARDEAYRWIKGLRLVPFDGTPMRRRFRYRGDSLWWFTELYLHKMRRLDTAISTLLALDAAVAHFAPVHLRLGGADETTADAARAFCAARGLGADIAIRTVPRRAARFAGLLVGVTAQLSRLRPARPSALAGSAPVAAFVHTAFWRSTAPGDAVGREHYLGAVLEAIVARTGAAGLACIGVGPKRHFRARRWWDPLTGPAPGPVVVPIEQLAPRAALREALDLWRDRETLARAVVSGAEIRAAGEVLGCDLWPILARELAQAARVQWPWSARAMDEAAAALDRVRPRVAVTYAEAGGWGRAMVLEARRRGIPSVGVQHGFIYRHWLNYRHEADEIAPDGDDAGAPLPTRTLLFDGYAAAHLEAAGHFPPSTLAVTGSPRLDELAARVRAVRPERDRIRGEFGAGPDDRVVLVASKFSDVRAELPALLEAASTLPGVRLIVKPHPADAADDYRRAAGAAARLHVTTPDADLGRLLAAADALVTINSTVALDAMVLGIPALVGGLPNNLSPFVDAGVMLGASPETTRARLETLLYDRRARQELLDRAAHYAAAHDMRADGRAAVRAADVILDLAPA